MKITCNNLSYKHALIIWTFNQFHHYNFSDIFKLNSLIKRNKKNFFYFFRNFVHFPIPWFKDEFREILFPNRSERTSRVYFNDCCSMSIIIFDFDCCCVFLKRIESLISAFFFMTILKDENHTWFRKSLTLK